MLRVPQPINVKVVPLSEVLNVKVVPLSEVPVAGLNPIPSTKQPLLLVVDDERIIADTLSAIFTKVGFATMTAYDGKSALNLISQRAPAILVSDVCMPRMDGVTLAMAVSEVCPECKILLLSAHVYVREQVMEARDQGYDFHFLAKPVHPTKLVGRVTELMNTVGPPLHSAIRHATPRTTTF